MTINALPLKEIERRLLEPLPSEYMATSQDGSRYFPIEAYERRLNEVVGILNYDFICSDARIDQINGQPLVYVTAKVVIKDDNGNPVVTKSACGGSNVVIVNATGKPKSQKSELDTAVSEAFKNCCKKLGIGVEQLRQTKREVADNNKNTASKDVCRYRVVLESKFQSGNGFYHAIVRLHDGTERLKFMVFKKEYPNFESAVKISDAAKWDFGMIFAFTGKISEFRGEKQLVFVEW